MESREGASTGTLPSVMVTPAASAAGFYKAAAPPPPLFASAAATAPKADEPTPVIGAAASPLPSLLPATAAASFAVTPVMGLGTASARTHEGTMKKKRGRPRKYGPDGSVLMPMNPRPISTSAPGQYPLVEAVLKRARGRPGAYVKKQHRIEFRSSGFVTKP